MTDTLQCEAGWREAANGQCGAALRGSAQHGAARGVGGSGWCEMGTGQRRRVTSGASGVAAPLDATLRVGPGLRAELAFAFAVGFGFDFGFGFGFGFAVAVPCERRETRKL